MMFYVKPRVNEGEDINGGALANRLRASCCEIGGEYLVLGVDWSKTVNIRYIIINNVGIPVFVDGKDYVFTRLLSDKKRE